MHLTAIVLGREVGVETVIDVTHAVIGILQTLKTHYVLLAVTSIEEVAGPALGLGRLLMTDIIGLVVGELDEKMMTVLGIEAHVVTVPQFESEHQAQSARRASLQPHNLQKTNAIDGLCLSNNLLLG